jgi:hypothetical protein
LPAIDLPGNDLMDIEKIMSRDRDKRYILSIVERLSEKAGKAMLTVFLIEQGWDRT